MDTRFQLTKDFIKLSALLKAADIADSGGQAKNLIQAGGVRVNGVVETRPGKKIRAGDLIEVDEPRARIRAE